MRNNQIQNQAENETLWSREFILISGINFLMFFSFYQLLPVLPLYLLNEFSLGHTTSGVIISLYTVGALCCRPFAGFLVDSFSRKPLYFWMFLGFTLCFIGYKAIGIIPLLGLLRLMHGITFGIATTAGNTIAIDVLPRNRRGEGIGYFGISVNLAFALGPMMGMFLYEATHEKYGADIVFIVATVLSLFGLILIRLLRLKPREIVAEKQKLSLDRFFLTNAIPQFLNFICIGFAYGPVTNYIALYASEIHVKGSGIFYALIAAGLITIRLATGKLIDRGYLLRLITIGMSLLTLSYFMLSLIQNQAGFYISAFIIGCSLGLVFPGYQTMCVNLARHNQRGTANSTYLSGWDIGIGSGIFLGGIFAEKFSHSLSYLFCAFVLVLSLIMFVTITKKHYISHKVEE